MTAPALLRLAKKQELGEAVNAALLASERNTMSLKTVSGEVTLEHVDLILLSGLNVVKVHDETKPNQIIKGG